MAQHTTSVTHTKRPRAYENLINSFDTDYDVTDLTFENLSTFNFDR